MPLALICSPVALEEQLERTVLCRHDLERCIARTAADALLTMRTARPDLVVVDSDLPDVQALLAGLRADPTIARVPVALLAREGLGRGGAPLLDAGVNEVLTPPPGPHWDEPLLRIMPLRVRRNARYPLDVDVEVERDGSLLRVKALNLSGNGLLVRTADHFRLGENLVVSFLLPGSTERVAGHAWVVRQAAAHEYGIEFLYLEHDGLDRVRHFVATWTED